MTDESTLRRSERAKARERVEYREGSVECDAQSDSDDTKSNEPLSYGLKLRAADPRYITKSEDCNRGDIILTIEQVRELIAMKSNAEEGTATIWLTTAEMGFSLTEEPNAVVCTKDVKEGKVNDRYLAPAISRFAAVTRIKVGTEADMDKQAKDVEEKLEDLHQRWGKANMIPSSEDIKAQACNEAKVTTRFIRIILRP
jgi:hypothetical protein